ncbi:DUF2145 domain-containing protein [Dinoroseobacter sp. S76]|uniref:DUF2145 domain-containing protein n=1 Tax=Dinoroseobacter sp. S76 TaxID=3415124 RepID=UPI003C7D076B
MGRFFMMLWLALAAAFPTLALAGADGSSAAGTPRLPAAQVAAFSNEVQQDLAARGAHVAIVARMGRDPSSLPDGVRYTHVGFWVYSRITEPDGTTGLGYRVYNLYQLGDDPTRSQLIQDSPADFFAGAHRLDAGVIIPEPELQRKLLGTITSPTYARLHNPDYAVLANPRSTQFQNCTEHTLDVLMASLYDTSDIGQIKANISAYFQPQPIALGGLKRAMAPIASGALTTEDHGSRVATTTFGSLARFMEGHDLAMTVYRVTPDRVARF